MEENRLASRRSTTYAGRLMTCSARQGLTAACLLCLSACGQGPATGNVAEAADRTADAIANRADAVRRMTDNLTANVEDMPDDLAVPGNRSTSGKQVP